MTKDELISEHHMAQKMSAVAKPHHHANVSIEYAIGVLKEVKDADYQIITDDGIICIPQDTIWDKINELRKLLK